MTGARALAFVRRHGVVLASAQGPVPSLAEAVAGAPVKGSWWGHPKGREIFAVLEAVADSPEILICRLVAGKITFVHRRLWPALVRTAGRFPAKNIAQVRQEHTASGRHLNRVVPFPKWAPAEILKTGKRLSEAAALDALGPWVRESK